MKIFENMYQEHLEGVIKSPTRRIQQVSLLPVHILVGEK